MVRRRYEIYLRVFNSIIIVRYLFEHEKRNFISPRKHVLFCLFYKPTNKLLFLGHRNLINNSEQTAVINIPK